MFDKRFWHCHKVKATLISWIPFTDTEILELLLSYQTQLCLPAVVSHSILSALDKFWGVECSFMNQVTVCPSCYIFIKLVGIICKQFFYKSHFWKQIQFSEGDITSEDKYLSKKWIRSCPRFSRNDARKYFIHGVAFVKVVIDTWKLLISENIAS